LDSSSSLPPSFPALSAFDLVEDPRELLDRPADRGLPALLASDRIRVEAEAIR
jgi:hypothetical protein